MKTKFINLSDLKKNIEEGQHLYIENHVKPDRSRVTTVKTKQSYFFTVLNNDGKESWIINGAVTLTLYGFQFKPDQEIVEIYYKNNFAPFVTLHFNDTIIKGKSNSKTRKKIKSKMITNQKI